MEIMDAATALGNLIKNSEEYQHLEAAKAEYAACTEVSEYMTEYDTHQKALESLASKPQPDTVIIDNIQNRLNVLFKQITEHPVYRKLYAAQEEVDKLMNEVNDQITFTITGEKPCSHDCSSCHCDCN